MELAEIVAPLLEWYGKSARILPWRSDPRPYPVWLSEIMLQQTRVEAVKPYFERFLQVLPDVRALADAPEELLMKLWQGLGYYNRVRTMQRAARQVVGQYGELPASYEQLRALPGFGEYTAGAVSSIAFGIPVPAVDGNVLRVISRLLASFEDVSKQSVKADITGRIAAIEPESAPGDFNQALMELGATVCLPNGAPRCGECPLRELCRGYGEGVAAELPKKPAKAERRWEERTVFLLFSAGEGPARVALHKRPDTGLLAGLWEFPSLPGKREGAAAREALLKMGIPVCSLIPLGPARHIFSHVEWHMTGWLAECETEVPPSGDHPEGGTSVTAVWATGAELREKYALPSALKVYLAEALRRL